MKKIIVPLMMLVLLVIFPIVSAQQFWYMNCELYGKEVPCSEVWIKFGWLLILIVILAIISFILWLWMLIDCIKRDFGDENILSGHVTGTNISFNKIIWILILLATLSIGAIIYYFVIKMKEGKLALKALVITCIALFFIVLFFVIYFNLAPPI